MCDVLCCRFTLQAEEVQARMGRQSSELTTAIASAKEREAEAVRQLREAETKLCEAVQRDERWVVVLLAVTVNGGGTSPPPDVKDTSEA